ncbi:MAG: proton-conducting transporter membrane subunit [Brachymonas sp.]|nr:proton-conducting transporter membrane subunit [Brachymonas sp.]
MTSFLIVSPVLLPLLTAAFTGLFLSQPALQRTVSLAGAFASLCCAVALVWLAARGVQLQMVFGMWDLPYGIGFRIDRLGSAMLLISSILAFVCLVFLASDADPGAAATRQLPLIHGLMVGVGGAYATADLFNMYVWFEVMLVCSVGLLGAGGKPHQLDGALKYMTLNMLATLLLLVGVVMVYGLTGHLSFDGIRAAWPQVNPAVGGPVLALLCLALLAKAGAFPFFGWLPPSYPTLPAPTLALFAGLLTKVGTYVVLRVLGDVFVLAVPGWLNEALGWIACLTMFTGVLAAAYHWDMRRILALHIISQIGYILLAIALGSKQGLAAALFFIIHNILAKSNLFLIAAMVAKRTGSYDLRRIGGLYAVHPVLALLFGISALSLVGIPPFTGFWAKLLVLQATHAQARPVWLGMALLVSLLTMYSMIKIWMEAFWKPHPQADATRPLQLLPAGNMAPAWIASLGLTALLVFVAVYPQALIGFANAAAQTLGGTP